MASIKSLSKGEGLNGEIILFSLILPKFFGFDVILTPKKLSQFDKIFGVYSFNDCVLWGTVFFLPYWFLKILIKNIFSDDIAIPH